MSTLIAPVFTVVDKIPLGRRIEEIKKEKGGFYSNVAMAGRLGIHTETLRLMLKGKRDIYTFELDKIAKDLKMQVDRILQEDVKEETERLSANFLENKRPAESLELALRLAEQTIGLTERYYNLKRLGIAYRNNFQFSDSNKILQQAHQFALTIKEQYGETDALQSIIFHLTASFTDIQDYTSASKLLNEVEPFFVDSPITLSSINYQNAKIEESKGNIYAAKKYADDSLQFAIETGNSVIVARARLNLSHYNYITMNYQTSRELLELAIEGLYKDTRTQLIARKELVKTFLKMGMKRLAVGQIEIGLEDANKIKWLDMVGKLTILLTLATGEPTHAQAIVNNTGHGLKIRWLSCKCLQDHYKALNDSPMFLHYSKIAEGFCVDFTDVLDEGEL